MDDEIRNCFIIAICIIFFIVTSLCGKYLIDSKKIKLNQEEYESILP